MRSGLPVTKAGQAQKVSARRGILRCAIGTPFPANGADEPARHAADFLIRTATRLSRPPRSFTGTPFPSTGAPFSFTGDPFSLTGVPKPFTGDPISGTGAPFSSNRTGNSSTGAPISKRGALFHLTAPVNRSAAPQFCGNRPKTRSGAHFSGTRARKLLFSWPTALSCSALSDTQPLPAAPGKWTYRGIYRVDDDRVGQWSNPVSVMVG